MAIINSIGQTGTGLVNGNGAGVFTAVTTTANEIQYGAANNSLSGLALTDGQFVAGNTGSAPTATALDDGEFFIGNTGAAPSKTALEDGELFIGNTAALPTAGTLTAGTGVSITSAAGSITINAVGSGLSWTVVTDPTQNLAVNNGYISNDGSAVTFTLPATSVVGSVIKVAGLGAGGWVIDQNAGQLIHLGASATTVTSGTLASTNRYDAVTLVCAVADTEWLALSYTGNITVT